ncbi:hypothetical protein A6S26_21270 [Nostoc sp. ATCC 43529]|nr:hypothetical protein A6S26_21270 [Nostoc sp. ATCC 43529]
MVVTQISNYFRILRQCLTKGPVAFNGEAVGGRCDLGKQISMNIQEQFRLTNIELRKNSGK